MNSALTYITAKLRDLGAILRFDLKAIWYPVLAGPVVLWIAIALAVDAEWLGDAHSDAGIDFYNFFDTAALFVLWAATATALVRLIVQRQWYFLWLAVLVGTLLVREYHFEWANLYAHIAVPVIFIIAWLWYRRMANYFATRTVVTLVALGFFCYVISQSLDQRAWKHVFETEENWEKVVEETMEVAGHCVFLLLTIASRARGNSVNPLAPGEGHQTDRQE